MELDGWNEKLISTVGCIEKGSRIQRKSICMCRFSVRMMLLMPHMRRKRLFNVPLRKDGHKSSRRQNACVSIELVENNNNWIEPSHNRMNVLDHNSQRDKSIWWNSWARTKKTHAQSNNNKCEKHRQEAIRKMKCENWWFLSIYVQYWYSILLQYWSRTKRFFSNNAPWKWTKLMHHTQTTTSGCHAILHCKRMEYNESTSFD